MTEPKSIKPRLSLTKSQVQAETGAELLSLCQTVTEDGSLSEQEVDALKTWLEANRSADLPSVEFLMATVERIVADGKITKEERKELYKAIESVLPREARKDAVAQRKTAEAAETAVVRAEREAEKQRAREDRVKKRPVASANFMVAGVRYEGRPKLIGEHVSEDDQVFLVRDRANKYSRNATEIRLRNGYQIGFIPEDDAVEIAPLLDKGCPYYAFVTKILTGGRAPIPVVQAYVYGGDSGVEEAVFEANVPQKRAAPKSSGCFSVVLFAFALILLLAAILPWSAS